MADLRASGLGGVPKGETADRPSSPSIGDVFYNGTLGCLEIYTSQGWVANSAPPGIPTIGTVTYSATDKAYNNSSASVAFTPGEGGGLPNLYRATSTPGGYSGTATSSPIIVEGLQSATSYTFSVTGTNNFGTSAGSINSNSITANTVPEQPGTPVASYLSSTSATLTFTPGATGGSAITNYKYSTDGINYTEFSPAQTSSPLTISGLAPENSYTFKIKAINSNGDSTPSNLSNSLYLGFPSVSGGTLSSDSTYYYRTFTSSGSLLVSNMSLPADILLIGGGSAGGAGEGSNAMGGGGGGGGAGGVLNIQSSTIPVGSNVVVVGSGGAGVPSPNSSSTTNGGSGTASYVNSLQQAYPGGPGSGEESTTLISGLFGSSGGAGGDVGSLITSHTPSQGYSGGAGTNRNGGGGGGSGSDGSSSSTAGGAGGNGTNLYTSWISAITSAMSGVSGWSTATSSGRIGGGGGGGSGSGLSNAGGAGGAGGGGAGSNSNGSASSNGSYSGVSGAQNTGSGGGAHSSGNRAGGTSGSGGSGLIVFRYTKASVGE